MKEQDEEQPAVTFFLQPWTWPASEEEDEEEEQWLVSSPMRCVVIIALFKLLLLILVSINRWLAGGKGSSESCLNSPLLSFPCILGLASFFFLQLLTLMLVQRKVAPCVFFTQKGSFNQHKGCTGPLVLFVLEKQNFLIAFFQERNTVKQRNIRLNYLWRLKTKENTKGSFTFLYALGCLFIEEQKLSSLDRKRSHKKKL